MSRGGRSTMPAFPPVPGGSQPATAGRMRVLVVDSGRAGSGRDGSGRSGADRARDLLHAHPEEAGIAAARGYRAGLRHAAAEPPDVVLVAHPLGRLSGLRFAWDLVAAPGPAPAVVILAAMPEPGLEEQARQAGAEACLVAAELDWPLLRATLRGAVRARRLQNALEASEQRLRDIAVSTSNWFWQTDEQHRFTYFSDLIEEGAPVLPAVALGLTRWEIAGAEPESDPLWQRHLHDLERRLPFRDFTYCARTPSGPRWVRVSGGPFYDEAGRFRGYRGAAGDITGLVEAERRAVLAQARLSDALETQSAGVALHDAENRLIFCNAAYRALYPEVAAVLVPGERFEDQVGAAAAAGMITLADARREVELRERLRQRPDRGHAMEWRSSDGRWILLNTHATARGEIISIHVDISSLKAAELAVRDRELRLQRILGSLGEAVVVVDRNGRVEGFNQAAERIFGWTAAEIVGRSVALLVPRQGPGEPGAALLRRLLRIGRRTARRAAGDAARDAGQGPLGQDPLGRDPLGQDHLGRRRDGSLFPLELTVSAIGGRDDRTFIGIVRDLSARRALEAERRKLELAVEHSPSGILITTADGRIEYVNPRFTAVTGWSLQEVVGRRPWILDAGSAPRGEHDALWDTIRAGRVWHGTLRNRRKDGSLYWTENRIAPIRTAAGEISHFVAIEEDVTEAKQREEELQRAKEEAEIANRTKSEFLANISHELRTPLNAIIGFSQLLAQEAFGPLGAGRYRGYAEDILRSGHHLLGIIDEILDISRIELGRTELTETLFHPAEQVEACLRMFRPRLAEAGLTLSVEIAPDLPVLRGDQLRFRQILLNLLSNSAKFTPAGGRLSVAVQRRADADGLDVVVRDSGIGMTQREIGLALMPFAQVEGPMTRKHGGTGLGLTIARALVEQHQGRLLIDSVPGEGTAVTVRFPASRLVAASGGGGPVAAAPAPQRSPGSGRRRRRAPQPARRRTLS